MLTAHLMLFLCAQINICTSHMSVKLFVCTVYVVYCVCGVQCSVYVSDLLEHVKLRLPCCLVVPSAHSELKNANILHLYSYIITCVY